MCIRFFFWPNGETYTWVVEGALAQGPHKVFFFTFSRRAKKPYVASLGAWHWGLGGSGVWDWRAAGPKPAPCQATRDLVTQATMAYQDSDNTIDAQNAKAAWRDIARDFLAKSAEDNVKSKPRKLHRTKVYEWLCATSHMLRVAMGKNGHLGWPGRKWAT